LFISLQDILQVHHEHLMTLLVKVQPKATFRFRELKECLMEVFKAYPRLVILTNDRHNRTSHI
jgi:hypothetical protein